MSEYKAQLLAVEAKLAKDPENEELLSLKSDLEELIELSCGLEEDNAEEDNDKVKNSDKCRVGDKDNDKDVKGIAGEEEKIGGEKSAMILANKKEKKRKKKAKLRERIKEQLDIAESEKQSWQSFANKKGLKGVTKKSIFASPCSVSGKVGVGTNGIADAPSALEASMSAKRKPARRE